MKRNHCVLAIFVVVLGLSLAQASQVIDRILVTVNGRAVLVSDWEDALRFEAFLQGRPMASFTASERQQTLDRVIDQELLRQQMPAGFSASPEQVQQRIAEIRSQIAGASTDEGWRKALAVYGMTPSDLEACVAAQMQVLLFVDLRLRPTVRVEPENVESYYREKLVPELQKAGARIDPLPAVSGKIEEVLAQQRMEELLTVWLSNLRNQSLIHVTHDTAEPNLVPGGGVADPRAGKR